MTRTVFDEPGCQRRSSGTPSSVIRAPVAAATCSVRFTRGATTGAAAGLNSGAVSTDDAARSLLGPSENTCSCETVPPFDDVGVPPTVTATYSLPSREKIVGPAAIARSSSR